MLPRVDYAIYWYEQWRANVISHTLFDHIIVLYWELYHDVMQFRWQSICMFYSETTKWFMFAYWLVSYWPVWQTLLPAAPSGWPSARLPNKMMTGFGGLKALRPSKQCSMLSGYHPVCRGGILFSDPHITSVSIYLSKTFYLLWLMISDRYSAMKQW